MSYASILSTVNLYTLRESELTNQISDIMMDITSATKEGAGLAEETSKAREELLSEYNSGELDDTKYTNAKEAVQDNYNYNLSQITAWESELETEKDSIQTELQATSATKESYQAVLKQNVTKAHTYGGSSSTTS